MKFLFWLAVVLLAAVLAVFAVSNRAAVTLGLWPLPFVGEVPVYLPILLALLLGFVAGATMAWLAAGARRRESRRRRRRITALERELTATQAQLPSALPT